MTLWTLGQLTLLGSFPPSPFLSTFPYSRLNNWTDVARVHLRARAIIQVISWKTRPGFPQLQRRCQASVAEFRGLYHLALNCLPSTPARGHSQLQNPSRVLSSFILTQHVLPCKLILGSVRQPYCCQLA